MTGFAILFVLALAAKAEIELKNFAPETKPQDDFYRYANGNWLKNNPIPGDQASWGSFSELAERNQMNLRAICERVAAKTAGATPVEKMVGDFYASGIDEAAINAAGGSAELVIKPGGGHPWLTMPEEVKKMADWFDKQLVLP